MESTSQKIEVTIREVPLAHVTGWLKCAWYLMKKNYKTALGVALFIMILGFITYVFKSGSFVVAFVTVFIFGGYYPVIRKWINNEAADFAQIFKVLDKREILNRLLPIGLVNGLLSLGLSQFADTMPLGLLSLILSAYVSAIVQLSTQLVIFKEYSLENSIRLSLQAIHKNIIPFLWLLFLATVLGIVSAIALVLPLIFLYLPSMLLTWVFIYLTIFEGLDPVAMAAQLKNK